MIALHQLLLGAYIRLLPGVIILTVIQALDVSSIQKVCALFVVSGLLFGGATGVLQTHPESTVSWSSRQVAHILLMLRVGLLLALALGVGGGLTAWVFNAPDEELSFLPLGLIVTAALFTLTLVRFWPYWVLAFIFPDTPRPVSGSLWYFGLDRRKPLLRQPGGMWRDTTPAALALLGLIIAYASLMGLGMGPVRKALLLLYFFYLTPLCALVVAQAGVRASRIFGES